MNACADAAVITTSVQAPAPAPAPVPAPVPATTPVSYERMYRIIRKELCNRTIAHGRFHVETTCLGYGGYGVILAGYEVATQEPVAIKVESVHAPQPQIQFEHSVYAEIHTNTSTLLARDSRVELEPGFPRIFWCGVQDDYAILVMQRLGRSVESILNAYLGAMPAPLAYWLAHQMLQRIQTMHNKGFLHRDLKPDNFMIGPATAMTLTATTTTTAPAIAIAAAAAAVTTAKYQLLYLIDMGLCKKFWSDTKGHIPYQESQNVNGTIRYASIHAQFGEEQSRRDDLESWFYLLVYMLYGRLPWQQQPQQLQRIPHVKPSKRKDKQEWTLETKISFPLYDWVKPLGETLLTLYIYLVSLPFDSTPDYAYLARVLEQTMEQNEWTDHMVMEYLEATK